MNIDTVWVLEGNGCFAVFSSKEYAEECKKSQIEIWKKSIIRESIPRSLDNRSEIEKYADDYEDIITVGKDHYVLVDRMVHERDGPHESMFYRLISNERWEDCYKNFVKKFVIKSHIIVK
jgi:hypothetical protein